MLVPSRVSQRKPAPCLSVGSSGSGNPWRSLAWRCSALSLHRRVAFPLCVSLASLLRTSLTGFRAHPTPGGSHFEIFFPLKSDHILRFPVDRPFGRRPSFNPLKRLPFRLGSSCLGERLDKLLLEAICGRALGPQPGLCILQVEPGIGRYLNPRGRSPLVEYQMW